MSDGERDTSQDVPLAAWVPDPVRPPFWLMPDGETERPVPEYLDEDDDAD